MKKIKEKIKNIIQKIKDAKPDIIANFIAFVALNIIAAIVSYAFDKDYVYGIFYAAGLAQFKTADIIKKKIDIK